MIDFDKPPWTPPSSAGGERPANPGGQAKRVVIDGKVFSSPQSAAAFFGVSDTAIRNACRRGSYRA